MIGRLALLAAVVLLVGLTLGTASAHYTPRSGDTFSYAESIDLLNGTGNYFGYTESTTINGSLTRTRYANSGIPLSRRRNAASIFPFDRPSASNGEYWLDTITSIFGSSSRKIRRASGIHLNSCPVKKPMVKQGLLG